MGGVSIGCVQYRGGGDLVIDGSTYVVVLAVVVWSWDASCVHCESYCSTSRVM